MRHPEYGEVTLAEMLEHEQPQLMPMVSAFDGYVEEPDRVSSTCLVTAARNHYSVPVAHVMQTGSMAIGGAAQTDSPG